MKKLTIIFALLTCISLQSWATYPILKTCIKDGRNNGPNCSPTYDYVSQSLIVSNGITGYKLECNGKGFNSCALAPGSALPTVDPTDVNTGNYLNDYAQIQIYTNFILSGSHSYVVVPAGGPMRTYIVTWNTSVDPLYEYDIEVIRVEDGPVTGG